MELVPQVHWEHVSADNLVDCASCGLYPSKILTHHLWWNGPYWLKYEQDEWPTKSDLDLNLPSEEANELCSLACTTVIEKEPLIPFGQFSAFSQLKRVTAWMM